MLLLRGRKRGDPDGRNMSSGVTGFARAFGPGCGAPAARGQGRPGAGSRGAHPLTLASEHAPPPPTVPATRGADRCPTGRAARHPRAAGPLLRLTAMPFGAIPWTTAHSSHQPPPSHLRLLLATDATRPGPLRGRLGWHRARHPGQCRGRPAHLRHPARADRHPAGTHRALGQLRRPRHRLCRRPRRLDAHLARRRLDRLGAPPSAPSPGPSPTATTT